jgi:hypothetical protein
VNTNRGEKQEEDEDKNRVYNKKNTDLDSKLQIANDIKIRPDFTHVVISPSIHIILMFN